MDPVVNFNAAGHSLVRTYNPEYTQAHTGRTTKRQSQSDKGEGWAMQTIMELNRRGRNLKWEYFHRYAVSSSRLCPHGAREYLLQKRKHHRMSPQLAGGRRGPNFVPGMIRATKAASNGAKWRQSSRSFS